MLSRPNKDLIIRIFAVSLLFMLINIVAAVILQHLEPFTFTDAFYLSMSASTTTGYGNVAASTDAAKWFISFYQIIGFGILFYLYSITIVTDLENEKIIGNKK